MAQKKAFPQLREQAVALRTAGKSRREIKEILGIGSNVMLSDALRGVPPPPWTSRPRAKDDLHAAARELRSKGHTYKEIAAELKVSKSSVSLWVRDMPRTGRLSEDEFRRRSAANLARFVEARRSLLESRRRDIRQRCAAEIGTLSDREILIAGAIAYWCEGSKSKPHRRDERVAFINSDPQLILFFLKFLSAAGISRDRLTCRLYIHESADVPSAQRFWKEQTGLSADQFRRPTLKRHNPTTIRKNTADDYHGCLVIKVLGGALLYQQIAGWADGAMAAGALQRSC
jgi:transposase